MVCDGYSNLDLKRIEEENHYLLLLMGGVVFFAIKVIAYSLINDYKELIKT
jgi:hypothetical protein